MAKLKSTVAIVVLLGNTAVLIYCVSFLLGLYRSVNLAEALVIILLLLNIIYPILCLSDKSSQLSDKSEGILEKVASILRKIFPGAKLFDAELVALEKEKIRQQISKSRNNYE